VSRIRYEERHNPFVVPRGGLARSLFTNYRLRTAGRALPKRVRIVLRDNLFMRSGEKPDKEPEAREFLQRIYASEMRSLEGLLGRTLPWKLSM
jgi:hypothetical protein